MDDSPHDDLLKRIELLERENARLRRRADALLGPDKPDFDMLEFGRAMRFYSLAYLLPVILIVQALVPLALAFPQYVPRYEMLPGLPFFDAGGAGGSHPGMGLGVIAFGGLAIGVVAIGGGAIGVVAIGGAAVGLIAIGGGAFGVIAVGGGAIGYIAIGGGGLGRFVLAGDGRGKAVLSRRRQDAEAVEFFTRYFPRFKRAFTAPMPVIPVDNFKFR